MEMSWHHVAIAVEDMDGAKSFYQNLLGFELEWERERYSNEAFAKVVGLEDAAAHVVMLKGHGTRLELFNYAFPKGKKTAPKRQCDFGLTHFALVVDNLMSLYDRLLSAGVEFNCPPQETRPGALLTYMKDPEGNVIELVQYNLQ